MLVANAHALCYSKKIFFGVSISMWNIIIWKKDKDKGSKREKEKRASEQHIPCFNNNNNNNYYNTKKSFENNKLAQLKWICMSQNEREKKMNSSKITNKRAKEQKRKKVLL